MPEASIYVSATLHAFCAPNEAAFKIFDGSNGLVVEALLVSLLLCWLLNCGGSRGERQQR